MVTDTAIETDQTAPEPLQTETEASEVADAAPEVEAAAEPEQIQIAAPETPQYLTREEWEKEKAEVARQAAAEALEADRRRRQTENGRRSQQERREQDDRAELRDTVKAALGAQGIYEVPDETILTAVDRTVRKRSEQIAAQSLDRVDQAWEYLTAPVFNAEVEYDQTFDEAARRLQPRIQELIDKIRPTIEAQARQGYIPESELQSRYDAMDAARQAKNREGKEELARVEGTPAPANTNTLEYWERRIAHEGEDGFPVLQPSDWNTYRQLRRRHGL